MRSSTVPQVGNCHAPTTSTHPSTARRRMRYGSNAPLRSVRSSELPQPLRSRRRNLPARIRLALPPPTLRQLYPRMQRRDPPRRVIEQHTVLVHVISGVAVRESARGLHIFQNRVGPNSPSLPANLLPRCRRILLQCAEEPFLPV